MYAEFGSTEASVMLKHLFIYIIFAV